MSYPHGWGHSQPPSPPFPPSSSDDPHPPVNGNLYVMIGELVGNVRHLIWDSREKAGQIHAIREDVRGIQTQLQEGAHRFRHHDARLKSLEAEQVPRFEKLSKRWAAILLPPLTGIITLWLTGNTDVAIKIIERLPK